MAQSQTPTDRPHVATKRYIYAWGAGTAEGHGKMKDLLGGKGAGLAEMTLAGLPTPPGFTITTEACNDYFASGKQLPAGLWDDVLGAMREIEERSGKGFGDPKNPLLVSVRSGARFSMPGMMDTVLNLGLNEETLTGLVALTGNERFGWDAYRRFIAMFGRIVMDVPARVVTNPDGSSAEYNRFDEAMDEVKHARGAASDTDLDTDALKDVVVAYKAIVREQTGREFPTDVNEQLDLSVKAVFASWFGKRANDYRNSQKIAHDLGTAVNVVTMVFGNMGDDSGTGVAFTRNPNTGEKVLYGEYLRNSDGFFNDIEFPVGSGTFGPFTFTVAGQSKLDMWGLGLVQEIDAAAMSVWIKYRRMSFDVDATLDGFDLTGGTEYEDFQYIGAGAIIHF